MNGVGLLLEGLPIVRASPLSSAVVQSQLNGAAMLWRDEAAVATAAIQTQAISAKRSTVKRERMVAPSAVYQISLLCQHGRVAVMSLSDRDGQNALGSMSLNFGRCRGGQKCEAVLSAMVCGDEPFPVEGAGRKWICLNEAWIQRAFNRLVVSIAGDHYCGHRSGKIGTVVSRHAFVQKHEEPVLVWIALEWLIRHGPRYADKSGGDACHVGWPHFKLANYE